MTQKTLSIFMLFFFLAFLSCSKSTTQGKLCVYHSFNAGDGGVRLYQVMSDDTKVYKGTLIKYITSVYPSCDKDGDGSMICIYAESGSSITIHAESGPENNPTNVWDNTYQVSGSADECRTFELYE